MILPLAVGYLKMNSAKRINQLNGSSAAPVWQRNYYERVIRDDAEYDRIHLYIESNVAHWADDIESLSSDASPPSIQTAGRLMFSDRKESK